MQPFLEPSHWLQALFLDRFYAVAIPAGLILALVVFVFAFFFALYTASMFVDQMKLIY